MPILGIYWHNGGYQGWKTGRSDILYLSEIEQPVSVDSRVQEQDTGQSLAEMMVRQGVG